MRQSCALLLIGLTAAFSLAADLGSPVPLPFDEEEPTYETIALPEYDTVVAQSIATGQPVLVHVGAGPSIRFRPLRNWIQARRARMFARAEARMVAMYPVQMEMQFAYELPVSTSPQFFQTLVPPVGGFKTSAPTLQPMTRPPTFGSPYLFQSSSGQACFDGVCYPAAPTFRKR